MPVRHNKHVRFAYENVFHSPPATPVMPSLMFSCSTASSSASLITPPSTPYPLPILRSSSWSPRMGYEIASKPFALDDSAVPRPHPSLAMAGIGWDLMDHPSTISGPNQSSRAWKEPATNPTLPFISITIPNFPWRFNVYATTRSYVTCEDVVEKIYHSLRKNITESEFRSRGSLNDQRRASRAYEHRYRSQRSTKLYAEEKQGGMKRVDFLMERTRFVGLSLSNYNRTDEWQLNVT